MLIRGDTGDEVELTWKVDDPSLDLKVVVRVAYAGFSGSVATWVSRDTWEAFSRHLSELEHRRAGEARLNAIWVWLHSFGHLTTRRWAPRALDALAGATAGGDSFS